MRSQRKPKRKRTKRSEEEDNEEEGGNEGEEPTYDERTGRVVRKSRQQVNYDEDADDVETEEAVAGNRHTVVAVGNTSRRKRPVVPRVDADRADVREEASSDEKMERLLGFCCQRNCFCTNQDKTQCHAENNQYCYAAIGLGWHRRCCHKTTASDDKFDGDWKTEYLHTIDMGLAAMEDQGESSSEGDEETQQAKFVDEVWEQYNRAKKQESASRNLDLCEEANSKLYANQDYVDLASKFKASITAATPPPSQGDDGAVVLDLFAGIGTATLVLKKLKIKIKTVVVVEHDKIAKYVYRLNHDGPFVESIKKFDAEGRGELDGSFLQVPKNQEVDEQELASSWQRPSPVLPPHVPQQQQQQTPAAATTRTTTKAKATATAGGIEFHYEETFESLVSNLDYWLTKIGGVVDIVVAGPPCVDFSTINSRAQGVQGPQGQYLVQVGELIRKIKLKQRRFQEQQQPQRPLKLRRELYYVVENVRINKQEPDKYIPFEKTDLERINQAFGQTWDPIELDAADFSPCRRKRYFWTNIPTELTKHDYRHSNVKPCVCLQDDYHDGAYHIKEYDEGDEQLKLNPQVVEHKAQTFMASLARIDDSRMSVFQAQEGDDEGGQMNGGRHVKYKKRSINVAEREDMMGYMRDYVRFPVDNLFTRLTRQGYARDSNKPDLHWTNYLPPFFHNMSGNYLEKPGKKPFQFVPAPYPKFCELKLAHPPSGETLSHFNSDGYAKHLIGNAISVPVLELLLRPLQQKFPTKSYDGYVYRYKWEVAAGVTTDNENENIDNDIVAATIAVTGVASGRPLQAAANDHGGDGDETDDGLFADDDKSSEEGSIVDGDKKPAARATGTTEQRRVLDESGRNENEDHMNNHIQESQYPSPRNYHQDVGTPDFRNCTSSHEVLDRRPYANHRQRQRGDGQEEPYHRGGRDWCHRKKEKDYDSHRHYDRENGQRHSRYDQYDRQCLQDRYDNDSGRPPSSGYNGGRRGYIQKDDPNARYGRNNRGHRNDSRDYYGDFPARQDYYDGHDDYYSNGPTSISNDYRSRSRGRDDGYCHYQQRLGRHRSSSSRHNDRQRMPGLRFHDKDPNDDGCGRLV